MKIVLILLCTTLLLFGNDINHFNVKSVEAGSLHEISLTSENASSIYVHYRTNIADRFRVVEMEQIGYEFSTSVKIPKKNTSDLQYYFSIVDRNGSELTEPSSSPEENPYSARIVNFQNSANINYEIISPLENEVVEAEDFMVALSMFDEKNVVDHEKTKVFVNDIDLTDQADLADEIISLLPSANLASGKTSIKVELYNSSNEKIETVEWQAEVKTLISDDSSPLLSLNGNISASSRSETIGADEESSNYSNLNAYLYGNVSAFRIFGRARISSAQNEFKQDVNRFTVGAESGLLKFHLGDVAPDFHPMIMQNRYAKGFQAGVYFGFLNLEYAQGRSNREIKIDTEEENRGYFEREVKTGRLSFGERDDFLHLGITIMKSKDLDINDGSTQELRNESINSIGRNPEENLAVGVDLGSSLFNNRLKINTGIAISVMNENIRGGSIAYSTLDSLGDLDFSEEDYDLITKYITISGIPSISGVSLGDEAKFDPSLFGDVTLNAFNNYLKVKYEVIKPNYVTHGQPYLSNDIKKLSVYDRLRLLNNQLFITYQGSFQENNVEKDTKRDTRKINNTSFGVTFSPFTFLPSITARKGTVDQSLAARDSVGYDAGPDRNSSTFNIDLNHDIEIAGMNHNAAFSIGTRSTNLEGGLSNIDSVATEGTDTFFSVNSRFGFIPLRTSVQYAKYENITGGSEPLNTTNFSIRGDYKLADFVMNSDLNAFAQLRFSTTTNEAEPDQESLKQNSFEIGGRAKLPLGSHTLSASVSFKTVSFSGLDEYSNKFINLGAQYSF